MVGMGKAPLTRDDLEAVLGPIDDEKAAAILATGASQEELVEAWTWAAGDSEPLAAAGKSLTGRVADVYEILTADDWMMEE